MSNLMYSLLIGGIFAAFGTALLVTQNITLIAGYNKINTKHFSARAKKRISRIFGLSLIALGIYLTLTTYWLLESYPQYGEYWASLHMAIATLAAIFWLNRYVKKPWMS